jgi:hypothetical protein
MALRNAPVPSGPAARPERRHEIDALRVVAILLGIVFNSARAFNLEPWHVQNAQLSREMELLITFMTPWRMPLLFLLAGAGTYFALGFRSGRRYALERLHRLFVPLLTGMLFLVPVQVYVERISGWVATRMSPVDFDGSFLAFWPTVFTSGPYPEGNLSWHHLWFIAYLLFYSLLALPLFLVFRGERGRRFTGWLAGRFASPGSTLALAMPLLLIESFLRPVFGSTDMLFNDWANNAHYLTLFVYGYLLLAEPRLGRAIERDRGLALGLAVVFMTARLGLRAWGLYDPASAPTDFALWAQLKALVGWCAIVVLAYFVLRLDVPLWAKFALLAAGAVVASVALCELVKSTNATRFLFGMKPMVAAAARPAGAGGRAVREAAA